MSEPLIQIDGAMGEGGGQILRTAVGLSAAWGTPVEIRNIRANRAPGGMRAQHLAAVRAAAQVCGAQIHGDEVGSTHLVFRPGELTGGDFTFDIGTAGSAPLVAQTILPALLITDDDCTVTLIGGTHNPLAPCFEYLRDVWGVLAGAANLQAYFEMHRPGFYPQGGGRIQLAVRGLGSIDDVPPIRLSSRGDLRYIDGLSAVSGQLPPHIGERQAHQAMARLAAAGKVASLQQADWDTFSPGTVVFLRAVFSRTVAGFFALGERGKPAEQVADEAVEPLLDFLGGQGAVDAHAADQLLPLAAMSLDQSVWTTPRLTSHLQTNAQVVRLMTGREVALDAPPGGPVTVTVAAM